jgi:ABC-type phosphate transport system permease subunit
MGFLNTLLELLGFGIGLPFGLLIGFFLFVYSKPKDTVKVINRVSSSLSLVLSLSLYNLYVLVCWFFFFIVDVVKVHNVVNLFDHCFALIHYICCPLKVFLFFFLG